MPGALPTVAEMTMEAAGIGGWEVTVRTGFIRWTNLTFRIHELDPGTELSLRDAIGFFAPEAQAVVEDAVTQAVSTGAAWDLELPLVTARGRRIWVRVCGAALRRRGRTVKLLGSIQDVTARRDAMRQATWLQVMADQMSGVVIVMDRRGRIEWVNAAFTSRTGWTVADALGRYPGDLLNGPDTDPAAIALIQDSIGNSRGFEVEILDYSKDGSTHWASVFCSPVRDAQGVLSGFISVETDVTKRREAEQRAQRETAEREHAQALLRDVLDTLPSAVTAYDPDERLIVANRAYDEMASGMATPAQPGQSLAQVFGQAARSGLYADAPKAAEQREAWINDQLALLRDSSEAPRTVRMANGRHIQVRTRRSASGTLVIVRTDTTELVRAEALLRDVLDALPSAVTAYDRDAGLIMANRAHAQMLPIEARFARRGHRLDAILHDAVRHGQYPDAGATPSEQAAWLARRVSQLRPPGASRSVPLPDGRFVQERESRSAGGITVCIRTDTTDLNRAESDMRLQAERDPLTLLANRPSFLAALDRALTGPADEPGQGGALLLLDVDYFKQINDTFGHDMGDALLQEIAERLRGALRSGDVPARLGGDEFGVVIPGLTDIASLQKRLDGLHATLSAPATLAGRQAPLGISAGVTVFPADGSDAARLLKNADLALYEAKRNGRGRWTSFRPEQAVALEHHVHMADALRNALAHRQLTVALQPKRELGGRCHAGFEALARWHDGIRWVPPSEFIPVAEAAGLIGWLGGVVMDAALARTREIADTGPAPGHVAVNVAGQQLLDPNFKDQTLDTLARHRLQPKDLELELTETILFGRAAERIETVLQEFSQLGITLALDDFGTGYASLAHLSRLPIDRLKIDRSFVDEIGRGAHGGVIARTVINLAQSLTMATVAEGIETPEQLAFLEEAGCEVGQGYLFSRPLLTAADAIAYLRASV